ncbi:hypothetical protein ATCCBAA256_35950 [Mycobacterium montefiorense]|nr:hypothetical protein ATCCBAA256_35950 [Mycobacterium montefiorense]
MAAGTDADLVPVGLCVAQRADDVVGIDGRNDHVGVALGHALVPYGAAAGGFISLVAAKEVPPCR